MEVREGYQQTEIGVIPKDWKIDYLENISDVIDPHPSHRAPPKVSNGIPFLGIGDFDRRGEIIGSKIRLVSKSILDEHKHRYKLEDHLIGLGRVASIGKVIKLKKGEYTISPTLGVIKSSEVNSEYLYYILDSKAVTAQFSQIMSGSTRSSVGMIVLRKLKIPTPPEPEQKAIAKALSDVDALIDSLEQLIEKKRHLRQGAMQELLTGKRRLSEFEIKKGYKQTEVGQIPKDWTIQRVDEVSIVGRGRVISHKEIMRSKESKYPVYSSQTSNNGVMGYIDTYDFEGEYVTWTTDGANAGTVFYRNGKFNCTNVCGTIKLNVLNPVFFAKVLATIAPKHVSRQLGNPKLMNDIVKAIKVPFPSSSEEQKAIATILSDMDIEIEALEKKLAKTKQIKEGMMHELLTGRIRLI